MISKNLGILLVCLGLLVIIYSGYNYLASKKTLPVDSIEIKKETSYNVYWIPFTGIILLISGIMTIEKSRSKY